MSGVLDFLYTYVLILIFWFIVNGIFYALSILTKKGLFSIPFALNVLISWGIQIYLIFFYLSLLWQLITGKEWLLLIFMLIIGGIWINFWQMIFDFLMAPISGINIYFSQKAVKKLEERGEEFDYEYISPDGKVLGRFSSEEKEDKLLAKWFLINFGVAFLYLFNGGINIKELGLAWVFIILLAGILFTTLITAVFVGIWNLVKTKSFFGVSKKIFITSCLKVNTVLYGLSLALYLLF